MITWVLGMAFMIGTAIYQLYYFDKYKTISRFKAFFLGFVYFFIIFTSFVLPVFGGAERSILATIGTTIISLAVMGGIFFLIAKIRIAGYDTDYGNEKYVVAFKEILACIGMFFGIFSIIFMLIMALLGNPFERDDLSDD